MIPSSTQHALCLSWQRWVLAEHCAHLAPTGDQPEPSVLSPLESLLFAPWLDGTWACGTCTCSCPWLQCKIIPIASCKSSYLCAGRDRTWRLKGSKFLLPLLSPCSLSPGSPCIVPRHPGHGSHSPRPPSMIPMEPRLANPQSAKVVMLSARSWRAQWQGSVTSAQEQPQSTQR